MNKITDKRSALLQAALELFAEHGFNGSSTALIAKQARVASGTLFCYFKTKEELIRELYQEVKKQIEDLIPAHYPENMPVQERCLQAFSRVLRYFLDNPKEFKFMEQYHFSPFAERECSSTEEHASLRKLLIQAREQKIIRDVPLLIIEAIAFGPISSIAKEHANRGTPIDEEMFEQVVQASWNGLKR